MYSNPLLSIPIHKTTSSCEGGKKKSAFIPHTSRSRPLTFLSATPATVYPHTEADVSSQCLLEANVSTEVCLTVLDTLSIFIMGFKVSDQPDTSAPPTPAARTVSADG